MIGVAFGLGFVLGPALGGLLGDFSPRLPFWVAAFASLLNALYGFFVLPESLPKERRSPVFVAHRESVGSLKLHLHVAPTRVSLGSPPTSFIGNVAHGVLPSVVRRTRGSIDTAGTRCSP